MHDEEWLDQECRAVQRLIDSFSAIKISLDAVAGYVGQTDETMAMSGRVLGQWAQLFKDSARVLKVLEDPAWSGLTDEQRRRTDELRKAEAEAAARAEAEAAAQAEAAAREATAGPAAPATPQPAASMRNRAASRPRRRTVAIGQRPGFVPRY